MKPLHIIVCLAVAVMLILMSRAGTGSPTYGGLAWTGWASLITIALVASVAFVVSAPGRGLLRRRRRDAAETIRTLTKAELSELGLDKYRGPAYPHPVIFPDRCIGCQACVDACPHDVLAIVEGTAAAVAPDLCMEDTACQAECPVNPKACIVINTGKAVRSSPTPTRDGSTYETNVAGCYIIGDVSGVPLIKNAVKEGAEVIRHIAEELRGAPAESKAEYDVAIIGIGPGGASAAASAHEAGLRYIAIEQGKTLSTIDLYPKGKYIFFKPDTKDWFGGIPAAGLGLTPSKYAAEDASADDGAMLGAVDENVANIIRDETSAIHADVLTNIPWSLHGEVSEKLAGKIKRELERWVGIFLRSNSPRDLPNALPGMRAQIAEQLRAKIPGDQRENILAVWLASLHDKGVRVREFESCKTVTRADDGDYFTIVTESGAEAIPHTYKSRRVILAIGLRGAPNKLRLPNEDMKIRIEGREEAKVLYGLSNPQEYYGCRIVIVGGGNVAVESAVDLVATRDGASITPRPPETMNKVTMLVRDYLAPTVKFGNKLQLYRCVEDGLIDLRFGVGIREMRENEVVLEDVVTKEIIETLPNEYVFALIGGERPNRFLESIGITIE